MVHKDKLWIKFNELDIECFCAYNSRRCSPEKREGCGLYLAKFIPVEEPKKEPVKSRRPSDMERKLERERKKFDSELKKSIKKLKGFKI